MKMSQFNVDIPIDSSNGERVVFNTFTDSRCIMTPELDEVVKKACNGNVLSDEEKQAADQLLELGVLVPRGVDEDRELDYWFQKIKFDSSVFHLTVLTTYACNFGCGYCFEADVLKPVLLRPETIPKIVNWTTQMLDAGRPRTMLLTLFGGEPLINWPAIEMLCSKLKSITEARGIDLELQLITNGALLSEERVNFLTSIGPTLVKITLDGDEAAHDAKRPTKSGKGTFQTIINNLLPVLGKVDLYIGGNFDETNIESIPSLLDYLRSLGFDETNCTFGFKPIIDTVKDKSPCDTCIYSDTKAEATYWTILETERRGLKAARRIALQPCQAVREWAFTVDPFGRLYKCPSMVGRLEGEVGDITSENLNYNNTLFMTADHWKKCDETSFRPICNGGCGYNAHLIHGDYQETACEHTYIERVSLELVKDESLEALSSLGVQDEELVGAYTEEGR